MNRKERGTRRRSATLGRASSPRRWNVRLSSLFIYLLVFINSVLIISSANKIFRLSVGAKIPDQGDQLLMVEVQNGCGVSGIATRIGSKLPVKYYEIVSTGNADHWNYEHTTLIDLKGDKKGAVERLRKELGISKDFVYTIKEPSKADVRLIIGKDYESLKLLTSKP